MTDKPTTHQDRLKGILHSDPSKNEADAEEAEVSCAGAFGYLRGIRDQATSLEFRFLTGISVWFPYNWMGTWQFDPSEGLLLKFSGDLVYLVLIRGSNLDQPLSDTTTNLTTSGLQRHRIVWMREMSAEEIRQVGETGPTIDRIEVAEFESNAELKTWLEANAPAFLH